MFFSNDTKPKVIQHEHLAVGWKENVSTYLSLWDWTIRGDTSTASLKFKFTETYRIFHIKMYVQFTMKMSRTPHYSQCLQRKRAERLIPPNVYGTLGYQHHPLPLLLV
jgi:hypothetical protein